MASQGQPVRPNVLLLHCHDLGRLMGAYGAPSVRTPNLDTLAADGVLFTQAFATAPQCSPSRASLFTGRFPQQHGVLGLTQPVFGWDLAVGERHIARELSEQGYAAELIGVHHESLVDADQIVAERLGFDLVMSGGTAPEVATATEARLRHLHDVGKPFYLQVGFFEPHRNASSRDVPGTKGFLFDYFDPDGEDNTAIPEYLVDDAGSRAEVAELQGAIHAMDGGVGRVLHALEELDLAQNTIVIFTTDHGVALPGAKCTLYDPGIEVALILRAPSLGWAGGRHVESLVSNVDVVPTIFDGLGFPVPVHVAGRSLVPLIDGGATSTRDQHVYAQITYHSSYDPRRCVRSHDFKLIANFGPGLDVLDCSESWRPRSTPVRKARDAFHSPLELYDLRSDPLELNNVANCTEYSDTKSELSNLLKHWMVDVDDPLMRGAVAAPIHQWASEELFQTS